jgi:hypothetical protein
MTALANVSKQVATGPSRNRWLVVARAAWVLLALLYATSYLITLPRAFSEDPRPGSPDNRIPIEEFRPALAQFAITPEGYTRYTQWLNALVPLVYMLLGIFIFWRKSDDSMGILTSLLLIGFINRFDKLVGPDWAQLALLGNAFTTTITFLWFFIFPDGRFAPRWMRWLFILLVVTQVWRLFQEDPYTKSFIFVAPIIFGSIVIAQISHYRRATLELRRQIKWVVFGTALGVTPLFIYLLIFVVFQSALPPLGSATVFTLLGDQLWMFFVVVLPIALTFAIFRSRLFDIDLIIRRTLIYSLLTVTLALVYFGIVILLQQLFRALTSAGGDLAIILSTLAIAALFNPLRARIQSFIDLRFYRRKYDAQKVLAQFAVTARDETNLDSLTQELIRVTDETMQPERVELWLKPQE